VLLFPMLDGLLVPLIRSALRFLQAVSQSFEQTTHMSRMIADSKLPSEHYGHSLARPRFYPTWLDKIFSLVELIIPTTLDLNAGISKCVERLSEKLHE